MVRIIIHDESVLRILIVILKQFFDHAFVNFGLYTIFTKDRLLNYLLDKQWFIHTLTEI